MKIFHGLVNYGTQAGILTKFLRKKGVTAHSYTVMDAFNRQTDYEFKKRSNPFAKLYYYFFYYYLVRITCIFRYDIFHFYFGTTLLPRQIDLPIIKMLGKKVVMHYLGGDIKLYKTAIERYNLPPAHRFHRQAKEHDAQIQKRYAHEKKYVDLQLVCSPAHCEFTTGATVIPLALDVSAMPFTPKKINDEIVIMHAPTDRVFKGTDYIEEAIEKLKADGVRIKFNLVEKVTHAQLIEEYKLCDIFIDQISVGWYGTASIEAMAIGRPTVCFIDPIYFKYIDFADEIPIINATKKDLYDVLKNLITNKEELEKIAIRSRKFVEKIHDADKVTDVLIKHYNKVWLKN